MSSHWSAHSKLAPSVGEFHPLYDPNSMAFGLLLLFNKVRQHRAQVVAVRMYTILLKSEENLEDIVLD